MVSAKVTYNYCRILEENRSQICTKKWGPKVLQEKYISFSYDALGVGLKMGQSLSDHIPIYIQFGPDSDKHS